MIQLTIIDAIAWGFILTFWGAFFGMKFIERVRVKPLQKAFDDVTKMMLTHLEREAEMLKGFLNYDGMQPDGSMKSPIQFKSEDK